MENKLFNKKITVAIIGYGRLGKLLTTILLKDSHAKIMLISSKKISPKSRVKSVALAEIKHADIIIPCVPISAFEAVIKQIAPFLKKDAVIMDVCSVKTIPIQILKARLGTSTQIIASHPMFGPDSYKIKGTLSGLTLVLWNVSAKKEIYEDMKKFFSNLGLLIVELSPRNHDKLLAMSLGYSYLIGKINQRMNIKKTRIDTYDFTLLREHEAIIESDSEQLFFDMQLYNPYAKQVQKKLTHVFESLMHELKEKQLNEVSPKRIEGLKASDRRKGVKIYGRNGSNNKKAISA